MDDDDEDFEALFFTECEELLSDLQGHLDLLHSGEGDQETLNAAFRAVHSVKGGAAAFGFDNLISFAHKFESVMDLARSDELELTPDVCQVLLRSGDVMESLIEKARDGDNTPSDSMGKVLSELAELMDAEATSDEAAPVAAEAAPVVEDVDVEEDEQQLHTIEVHFKPDPGFFRAGHDALKMLGAAKALGLTKVEMEGDILPLPEFNLDDCTVSWRLSFETEHDTSKLEEFFLVYEAAATWEMSEESDGVETPAVVEKEAEPPKVEAEKPEIPNEPAKAKPSKKNADKPASAAKKPGVSKSLRVELARVDRLVNLVGEIVITQAAIASMDHGLEGPDEREAAGKPRTGTINLAAEHRGERVIITISDDGRGINREVVLRKAIERNLVSAEDNLSPEDIDQLIFHAGFSTAETVSSVSGRGVGMDVVKRKIQELGGRCWLKSEPGLGCTFTIALPLTLAVLEGMTIAVGEERYILPLSNVVEALRLETAEVHEMPDNSKVLTRRGEYLPVLSIRDALQVNEDAVQEDLAIIVDTESDGHIALLIDELIGQRQVVLKSLEANYHRVEGVSGATILGDGRVALILDVPNLVNLYVPAAAQLKETLH